MRWEAKRSSIAYDKWFSHFAWTKTDGLEPFCQQKGAFNSTLALRVPRICVFSNAHWFRHLFMPRPMVCPRNPAHFFPQQLLREDERVRLRWHLAEHVLSSQPFLAKLDPSASKALGGKMSFLSHWWDMGDIQESKPWGVQKIKTI